MSVEVGHEDVGVVQIKWVYSKYIVVQHDEVAALARLRAARCMLLLKCICGVDSIGIDDVLQRDALLISR
jgi:hypothetical protein